jgi:flavin reductase (DIM6/NTAB) family NADH-FMN oxidoreductase RutF
MDKVKLNNNTFVYPMPVTLVGAVVEGKPNFMPVGWVSRVNMRPPLIAVAIGRHHTAAGIKEHGAFSVNVPSADLLEVTDYCGLVSGRKVDKSQLFTLFYGELAHAPLIEACPVNLACRLVQTVELPSHTLFIGEIVEAYASVAVMADGQPDIEKIQPLTLTMPDNRYWTVGDVAGKAWGSGRDYKEKLQSD